MEAAKAARVEREVIEGLQVSNERDKVNLIGVTVGQQVDDQDHYDNRCD